MKNIVASILWGPGTNCHFETAEAFALAGAHPQIVLMSDLLTKRRRLSDADLLCVPGGFVYGDHFGSGWIEAMDLVHCLFDQLREVLERKIPVLGICNGFQVLVAAGLLPGNGSLGKPTVALDLNLSARFEHWNTTQVWFHQLSGKPCVWTDGLDGESMNLPVAHGEGRLIMPETFDSRYVVATYGSLDGEVTYPLSPNGSRIAGICDATGLIMGLMPHPERRIDKLRGGDAGLGIFQAGVKAVVESC